jgi:hypothetical protein
LRSLLPGPGGLGKRSCELERKVRQSCHFCFSGRMGRPHYLRIGSGGWPLLNYEKRLCGSPGHTGCFREEVASDRWRAKIRLRTKQRKSRSLPIRLGTRAPGRALVTAIRDNPCAPACRREARDWVPFGCAPLEARGKQGRRDGTWRNWALAKVARGERVERQSALHPREPVGPKAERAGQAPPLRWWTRPIAPGIGRGFGSKQAPPLRRWI